MDTAQWPQGFGVVKTGGETSNSKPNSAVEIKPRPEKDQALKCPRCNSTNTKFCYYNNYSLSQPRYFCKTCRRYWTAGGSLRNVPVGGGSRKNKRSSSTSAAAPAAAPAAKKIPSPPNFSPQNPRIQEGHDLNLAYNPSHFNAMSEFVALHQNHSSSDTSHHYNLPLMELLKTGNMCSAGGLSSFMSVPDFKPSLVDGFGGVQGVEDQTSRILFPLEDGKDQEREQNGYWNGMLAGGSW